MGGSTDDLDASLIGLVVGLGPGEGREGGVVDVNDGTAASRKEITGEHLHVAGKDDEIRLIVGENGELLSLGIGLGLARDRNVMEGHAVALGELAEVGMVGDRASQNGPLLPCSETIQEIVETMVLPGDEYGNLLEVSGESHASLHLPVLGGGFGKVSQHFSRLIVAGRPFDTLKKDVVEMVVVLVGMEDVATTLKNPVADFRHDTREYGYRKIL